MFNGLASVALICVFFVHPSADFMISLHEKLHRKLITLFLIIQIKNLHIRHPIHPIRMLRFLSRTKFSQEVLLWQVRFLHLLLYFWFVGVSLPGFYPIEFFSPTKFYSAFFQEFLGGFNLSVIFLFGFICLEFGGDFFKSSRLVYRIKQLPHLRPFCTNHRLPHSLNRLQKTLLLDLHPPAFQ